ncbi:12572_t:CDS:2, partial [Ambispora gerdemannii]
MNFFKISLCFTLVSVFFFVGNVDAHGRMKIPEIRLEPNDKDSDFTIARSPTKGAPCSNLDRSKGPVTNYASGASIPFTWQITAAHLGKCFLELSTDGNDGGFTTLKEYPNCADTNGVFNDNVQLPADVSCDKCTLRWRWEAKNTGELYINCANIQIGGSGGSGQSNPKPNPATSTSTTSTSTSTTSTSTSTTSTSTSTTFTSTSTTPSAPSAPAQPTPAVTDPVTPIKSQSASSAMTSGMPTNKPTKSHPMPSAATSGMPTNEPTKSHPMPSAATSGMPTNKPTKPQKCIKQGGVTYCKKHRGCGRKSNKCIQVE